MAADLANRTRHSFRGRYGLAEILQVVRSLAMLQTMILVRDNASDGDTRSRRCSKRRYSLVAMLQSEISSRGDAPDDDTCS
ncbi:hypothetical protein AMTR_s00005p00065440 [Amborella trichopoda]|uniref:Uncharacterized protein n=1 Tax=Amborella trichopoda TaxID=13333 RepID=W1PFL7_AMBTC|nr:hypothetical protein AMTR_s00005p00065440 [Amborella trichopoda]